MELAEVLDALRPLAANSSLPMHEVLEGLCLEFTDACDIFVVDQRRIESLRQRTPATAARHLVAQFQKLDQQRSAVLHGLRHWCHAMEMTVEPSLTGIWQVDRNGGMSTIDVGHCLTRLLQRQSSAEALQSLAQGLHFEKLSRSEAKRLIEIPEAPHQTPVRKRSDAETISHWSAQFEPLFTESYAKRMARYRRKNPWFDLCERLRERLGNENVGPEICSKKPVLWIEFRDGFDQLRFHYGGHYWKRLLNRYGSLEGIEEQIVHQFNRLDAARTQTIETLETLLAELGCQKDRFHWNRSGWWYGTTHQQFHFDPGTSLTRRLYRHAPVEFLNRWFQEQGLDDEITPSKIEAAMAQPKQTIGERMLPPQPFEKGPQLDELDALDFEAIDRIAAHYIEAFRQEAQLEKVRRPLFTLPPMSFWELPQWYARGRDTWVDDAWWINQARTHWHRWEAESKRRKRQPPLDQMVAFILLAYGDDKPREALADYYPEGSFYHPEAIDDGLSWAMEGELPWSMFDYDESIFPVQLGKLPPVLARKRVTEFREEKRQAEPRELFDEDGPLRLIAALDFVSAHEWMTPNEITAVHQICLQWATATDDMTRFWFHAPLQIAANFGWRDVVERLAQNPSVATSLTTGELGRWYQADFVLWGSLVLPGSYIARWSARLLQLDEEAEAAVEVQRIQKDLFRGSNRKLFPNPEETLQTLMEGQTRGQRQQKLAAAVAWHRCREAGLR
ncbi:hypothetical protein [Bremerella cremea]|uniref:hypothetical protein n=1 Tax=Bremerella cremea TaxID=1031537 RepID=UPI0031F161C9